ncbi:MAG: alpha/beta fold hydrolase [Enterococcus lacertideformus]|uniref:Alpha/beta fold hydrolase n=1 Tax=Enterococcus lacertideformus TaxID=2771493 RepID=A0A931AU90_9ENTE|nr:alpha/beta fold hydrolase [Enterococcus lacertideformus]
MKIWRKYGVVGVLMLISIFFISGCQSKSAVETSKTAKTIETTQKTKEKDLQSAIPTLFFHGYSGTVNSFKGMIQRLQESGSGKKEVTLTVDVNGNVQAEGELSKKADNPMIQVLFADNKNNEWNQTEWIKACLSYLQTTYGIEQVNVVGHSMGGVSGLRYLATYGQDTSLPKIEKFVAIGAPFNDFEDDGGQSLADELKNGPAIMSSRYQDYQQLIGNVPTTTQFLLVAGQLSETDLSDGTVPLNSALAVYALLKQHGNVVEEKVIKGENASHSMLHENQKIDREVSQFLWK